MLGVLLLASTQKSHSDLQIIDGQQRVLTFVLIFRILTGQTFDFEITSNSKKWADFWQGVKTKNQKDTIYFADIVGYCKKNDFKNESLKKIIAIVEKFKKETDVLPKVINFLKEKLYVTPLHIKSGKNYDYFEFINSTNVVLTLTEKCFAFIVEEYEKESLDNADILQCWLSYSRKKEKDMLVEYFIKIFNDKETEKGLDPFDVFKQLDKQTICNSFFKFLKIYEDERKKVISKKKHNFYTYYLYKIAWDNYWPIIVILKFKQFDDIFKYLLYNLWKIDLWTYCVGENDQQGSDTLPVAKQIWKKDNQSQSKKDLQDFLKNKKIKLLGISFLNNNQILSFPKKDLELICYDKKDTKRLKVFFWLLLSSDSSEELKKKMKQKSWINEFANRNWEFEHIVAKESFEEDINVQDKNAFKNLMLISSGLNKQIGNKSVSTKILDYKKNGSQYIFQYPLYSWIQELDKFTDNIYNRIWKSNKEIYNKKFDQNLKNIWKLNIVI